MKSEENSVEKHGGTVPSLVTAPKRRIPFFITPSVDHTLTQMPGLETVLLTGFHGEQMMMVLNTTLPGCTVPMHSHPHEQIGMVHSGEALLRIGDEERTVRKGDFYCIPSGILHGDTCISEEPFVMLDIFYPVRQDFIEKLRRQRSDSM